MRFKDRVQYIINITHELRITTKSSFQCFLFLLQQKKPKVVEVGQGEAKRELVPAMQPKADTGEKRLRGEPLQGISSPPGA